MPPSITDNPEAFFEELNKPQKEETAVGVSPVPEPVDTQVGNPLAGSTEPVEDQPKAKQASVADDPEAFFADLTKPAEPKEETPESVVLGQLAGKTGAQMDDFDMQSLNLLSPKELEEVTNVRKDIPLTENLLRTKFDYEMSLPWNEGVNTLEDWKKIGQEVFGGGVSFLKGAKKFAEQSLFSDADQDPSGWGHPSFKPIKDYASGITALPESAAYLFTKLKEGGIGLKDRLSESLGVQDREKSYENYKARNLVDRIQTQEMQENPSIYSRILKGDMANDALAYVVLNTLPDRETLMAQEGLTAEQADSKRKEIANAIARQTTSDIASREMPADEDIATFATFTAPAGLGLGEMGLVSLGLEAGMGLTPRLIQGAKYLGKTDQEIKAMNDAAQTLQREAAMRGLEQAQKPSLLGRAAGALATGIENVEAAGTRIGEATPKILKELAPPAIGAVVAGDERRGEGAIAGAVLGKAGRPALAALKYAAKTPALIRDIEEARVLAAGGSKGTFETLASFPEVSENTAKILRFGGRRLDNTINNVVEYAKAGVNPTLIALATGALESASPEELNKLTSTGLLYGLGGRVVHQAWGKITGVDPVIDARNRRQQDIDDLKTYRDLDPETRTTLDAVTSWDNIVDLHTQRAANAEQAYNDAVALGKKDAEQLGKVAQAERNILSAVTRANVQTRDEFSRQFVTQLTNLNQLVNGTLRAGQNNVGINILTPAQIVAKFRQDPANATATDQEILEVASQRGFYSTPEGAVEYQAGMSMDAPKKKIVFDRTKPSVVINADALKARMMIEGSTPIDALNHEVGHHVRNIPEFREANKDAEDLLFSQEVKDPAGNVVAVTAGQYSGKDLVDMYLNDYLKGKTPDQITQLSQIAGLWDYSRGALNETAVAEYMKDEIIAELNSETFSTHLGKGLDSGILHMVDVARLKTKKNLLDRAVQKFFGLGGKGEATSDLTGARFSPEVLAANRQAMRALQSLQGEVSQAVTAVESPKISRSEMLKNKAIRDRYGKYAGLFKTKMQGQVFDGNGNPIGTPIDIANPSASEGSWESRNGVTRQLNGYGARPDEVAEGSGVVIPDGGRLVVQKQIVTQPDGVTPVMMTPKEAKDLQKARAEVIRQSLNTPDEGAPNRFEPVNDDSATWRGTFTPLQIQAIKDMPEGIIPKSIKEHMLKINDMIVRGDGGRMLVDYAAVMNDAGKYTAYSPKVYDVVPIGMQLSKAGNFLVTTISVGRMFDKLNAWSERMPARLAPWGGSKDAFFKEFTDTYLQNWQYREKDAKGNEMYPRGKAGETGISGTPEEALAKKDIFNDFLNLTTNDFRGLNTDRTKTPRRRGDVRGKDIDRTIMSMRLDHMAELMDNDSAPKVPINYKNAISNFMPAEEPAPAQEERRQTPFDGITAAYNPQGRAFGARYVPAQLEGETKDDYVNRVMSARENQYTPDTSYTPLAGSQYDYMEGSSRSGANDISFMPASEEKKEEIKSALEDLSRNDLEDSEVFTRDLPNINDDSLSYVDTIGGVKQDNGYRYGGIQLYARDSNSGDSGIRDYGSHELFFYDNQDNPIGFARLTKDPQKASISMIAFTEESRGQGNGTAFYKYLLDDLGVSVVSDTEITSGTQSIYEKLIKDYNADVTNDGRVEIKSNISFMPREEEKKNLTAVHNLSEENLRNVLKVGGLAVPSVAVIRNDKSDFTSFGEITLVAPYSMVDPKRDSKSKVFNADVYSPRYPRIDYSMPDKKANRNLIDSIKESINRIPEDIRKRFFVSFETDQADRPMRERFSEDPIFMAGFLADTNRIGDVKFGIPEEERYADQSARWNVREFMRENPDLKEEFNNWIENKLDEAGVTEEEKLFAGYTPSGTRRYVPHTLDNVVKMMAKSLRDGEGPNYGVGSVRSKAAKQFRTLKQVQDAREQIVSKDRMEELKAEVNDEFDALAQESIKLRNVQRDFYFDNIADDMKALAEGGSENMNYLKKQYPNGAPFEKWRDYLEKLRNLPTEYFEAKIQRGVGLDEFAGAVVPKETSQDVIESLEKRGLQVIKYDERNEGSRAQAIRDIGAKRSDIAFMPKSEALEEERTERLPASGAELTASLVASGTSLESFGKGTLIQLAESYGIELPKDAKRGEIIDAINERPQPVAAQTQETDFRFMPSSKLDETYAKAVESGDMEEAQKLVGERARQAGGQTGFYHGTAGGFAIPRGDRGIAIHLTRDYKTAENYAKNRFDDLEGNRPYDEEVIPEKIYPMAVFGEIFDPRNDDHVKRLLEIGGFDESKEIKDNWYYSQLEDNKEFYDALRKAGFIGFEDREARDEEWGRNVGIIDPNNVKSLEPATYSNSGKLIPLSQRFDTSKPDIRYMPYSPELPKTEDGKIDWAGFKTKTMEIAKPLAGLELPLRGQVNEQEIPVANTKADAEKESADIELISTGVEVPESVDEQSVISNAIKVANSQPWRKGRDFKLDMQRRVMDAAEKAGVTISERTAESIEYLARVGLKDALIALEQNPNAIGWYDEKTKQALGVMSLLFPEIATDENARFAFTWALAVTSNGLKVDKNFELAERVYREYRKAGKMPTNIEAGQAQKAINEGLGLFNKLTKEWGVDNTRKFMQTDFSVGEVSRLSKDLSPSGEFADTNVRGSSILGPKIGNGFFSNLYGLFDALTMDRWLVRTWGRWTGTLVELNPELTKQAMDRLQEAVQKLTPEDKKLIEGMIKKDISEVSLEDLSIAIQKASMKPELRDLMNKTETGEELRKSGNGLAKYLDGQKEAPSGPTERNFIREIFGLMLEELKSDPRYAELTMADLQAVLWYAEKRLYETAKVKSEQDNLDSSDADGYEDDEAPDYANAAIGVAREKGVSQKRIDEVLEKIKNERTTTTRPETQEGGGDQSSKQESAGGFTGKEKQKFKQYVAVTAARRNRNGNEKALWSYARGGGKDSGDAGLLKPKSKKNLGVKYISEWKAGRKLATMFRNNGLPPVKFLELDSTDKASAKKFADTLQQSKDASVNGAAVYVYPAEDYQGMKLFISESGQSGFALKPDGDIVSVFSMEKGSGRSIMETAISAGGKKLDAFDTILPEFYGTHGFVEAARIPWNDEFAPEGWDKETFKKFNNGQPDVVMMVLDPKFEGEYEPRADIYVTDYDQAVEMQDSLLRKLNSGAKKKKQ
jgi:hypothetical protein